MLEKRLKEEMGIFGTSPFAFWAGSSSTSSSKRPWSCQRG